MGPSELDYGWHSETFVVRDVQIISSVRLQQLDKDGDWCDREPCFFMSLFSEKDEEKEKQNSDFENPHDIKYCRPTMGNLFFTDSEERLGGR